MAHAQNYYGTFTLYKKEVRRFLKVYHQTLIAPAVTAMMFLAIFVLAIGDSTSSVKGVPFIEFMGYGLIIMTISQNAFANSSSSLVMAKVIGYIIEILMPPISASELIIAYVGGAITRGIMTGSLVTLLLSCFVDFHIHHFGWLIFFTISSCILMGLLGIFTGIASNSFDQNAAITSYIVTPLSFLSGTFYSVDKLPQIVQYFNHLNPFYYMIDGFRYSLSNYADSDILWGAGYLTLMNILLFFALKHLIAIGWRIKS